MLPDVDGSGFSRSPSSFLGGLSVAFWNWPVSLHCYVEKYANTPKVPTNERLKFHLRIKQSTLRSTCRIDSFFFFFLFSVVSVLFPLTSYRGPTLSQKCIWLTVLTFQTQLPLLPQNAHFLARNGRGVTQSDRAPAKCVVRRSVDLHPRPACASRCPPI